MKVRIIFCIIIILLPCSCTTYQRYDYKAPDVISKNCRIIINLEGVYNKNSLIWGAPYGLQFWINVPVKKGLKKAIVRNIRLIGQESNDRYNFENVTCRKPRIYQKTNTVSTVGSVEVGSKGFKYETYLLKATIVLFFGESGKKQKKILKY